ncbi:hypothetical protein [Aeromicrobium sp. 50.2.37]|uniref:hypothetical protein n=1 Tax=Aeromicrobium sp. 50.2.37 TaxID=2969305 RepID=UPI00214F7DD3|nr:hypothetical protein [Aeromicrobium sp. 50.2.37]MCR4512322.1 hypothetical protein [Aeromicrobium sp. 50.2.37]
MRRRPLDREEWVVLGALALVVAALLFRLWAVTGSWFYSDDFIFLGDTATGTDRGRWFLEPHNVHFMPFSRWLTTLVGHSGPYAWWAAVVQILALQLAAAVACWWMLRTVFGDRPGILLPLALYLFSPATVPTTVWWAAAINQLPHQVALMGAVAAHVGYLRHRTPARAVLTGAFLVLGYASYTKSVLIPVLLLVVTFCYFASQRRLVPRLRETVGRYWHAWVVTGGLTVVYLWIYLTVAPSSPAPTPSVVFDTVDLSLVRSAVPALLGGPWWWTSLGQPGGVGPRLFVDTPLLLVVVAWLALGGLTVWQGLRRRRAWWPVLIVLGYAVLGAGIIAVGRATAFGPESAALELRYFADLAAVAALCLGLATMPVVGAHQSLEPREPAVLVTPLRRRWVVATAAAVLVSGLVSSVLYVRPWHEEATMPQRAYLATVESQTSSTTSRQVLDTGVPDVVLWSAAFPKNLTSRVLAPLGNRLEFVDQGVDLQMVDLSGRIVDAKVGGGARNVPGPVEDCGYLVRPGATARIPVAPVLDFPFTLSFGYLAAGDLSAQVTAGTTVRDIELESGAHTAFVPSTGAYEALVVRNDGAAALCIDTVSVGGIEPLEVPGA